MVHGAGSRKSKNIYSLFQWKVNIGIAWFTLETIQSSDEEPKLRKDPFLIVPPIDPELTP